MIDIAKLKLMFPTGKASLLTAVANGWNEIEEAEITTGRRIRHFLVQIGTETGGLRAIEESLYYTTAAHIREVWPSRFKNDAAAQPYVKNPQALAEKVYGKRKDLGNISAADGWNFRGGGFIQTTGRANYAEAAEELGLPLVDHPEMLRDPGAGFKAAVAFWRVRNLNAIADTDNLRNVRRAVNGGLTGIDTATALMKRALAYFPDADFAADPAVRAQPVEIDPADTEIVAPVYVDPVAPVPPPPTPIATQSAPPADAFTIDSLTNIERQILALYPNAKIKVDGVLDDETKKALLGFKVDWNAAHPTQALPLDLDVTPAVAQALMATPLPESRLSTTTSDLKARGSIIIGWTSHMKKIFGALLAFLGFGTVNSGTGLLDTATSQVQSAKSFWGETAGIFAAIPSFVWWAAALGIVGYALYAILQIQKSRVNMARTASPP